MTNLVHMCRNTLTGACVLVRVHASLSDLVDRHTELLTFRIISDCGLGPRPLLVFANGRVEEYLKGFSTLTAATVRLQPLYEAVAAQLARIHHCLSKVKWSEVVEDCSSSSQAAAAASPAVVQNPLPVLHTPCDGRQSQQVDGKAPIHPIDCVWSRIRTWLSLAVSLWADDPLQQQLSALQPQIDVWQAHLEARHDVWTTVCHNDLQNGNIMVAGSLEPYKTLHSEQKADTLQGAADGTAAPSRHHRDSISHQNKHISSEVASATSVAGADVCLIDYEYAAIAPVAFDVANHWCEWASDYHTDNPHMLCFDRLPNPQQQQLFIGAYLTQLGRCSGIRLRGSCDIPAACPTTCGDTGDACASLPCSAGQHESETEVKLPQCDGSASEWFRRYMILWGGKDAADSCSGDAVMPEAAFQSMVIDLQQASQAYLPISHLHWALWGFIQARTSSVVFDFVAYAKQRLNEYQRHPLPPGA